MTPPRPDPARAPHTAPAGEEVLARRFEEERPGLRAVAVRILGSETDADDVVQDAWLRLRRVDPVTIVNLSAWLTTVVGRLSLNVLRSRGRHPTDPIADLDSEELPAGGPDDPEAEAMVADGVGLAMTLVLDTLAPAERVSFVLHDVFEIPFEAIANLLDRSVESARQLASRARRRIRLASDHNPDPRDRRHDVVAAFFAAGRRGDLQGLLAVLHPDVTLRVDTALSDSPMLVTGAHAVAAQARYFAASQRMVTPLTLAALPGALITLEARRLSLMVFGVDNGKIESIDVLADTDRLGALDLTGLLD